MAQSLLFCAARVHPWEEPSTNELHGWILRIWEVISEPTISQRVLHPFQASQRGRLWMRNGYILEGVSDFFLKRAQARQICMAKATLLWALWAFVFILLLCLIST